uniref:Snake toxin/toxin-like domain-containing protein n=1 Tax=Mastacembelus armatus TaxID=205130 RepID=A0A3Q3MMR7_9TELE
MKTVLVALFLLVVVSQSEALKCYCGGARHCSDYIENCTPLTNACGSIIIYVGSRPTYSKGCMNMRDCAILNHPGISSASCCGTDLCNR